MKYYVSDYGNSPDAEVVETEYDDWGSVVTEVTSIWAEYARSASSSAENDGHRFLAYDLLDERDEWLNGNIGPDKLPYEKEIGIQTVKVRSDADVIPPAKPLPAKTVNVRVTHGNLNAHELSALLWDGIVMAAENNHYDAQCAVQDIPQGFVYPQFRAPEVKALVTNALTAHGRRSVECGSKDERWNEYVESWCAEHVSRAYGV